MHIFAPCVAYQDGLYRMWYCGSRGAVGQRIFRLGLAINPDGSAWQKSPHNPIYRPDPARPWESHYTTSQSVLRHPDGTWHLWYGARTRPPFIHKYFAIGTATWKT